VSQRARESTIEARTALFREATAAMAQRFADDIQVDDIAREIATSRRQLQRVFEEIGGTTFREHLTRIRMTRAAQMLESPLPIRDIAHRVGYRQPAQFAKAFRRVHGVTPSAYRDGS
jgi:AraC family transcriptional regulator of adaptative response / methylphosphotriester-DNA alkyltransferase methyltransferase